MRSTAERQNNDATGQKSRGELPILILLYLIHASQEGSYAACAGDPDRNLPPNLAEPT